LVPEKNLWGLAADQTTIVSPNRQRRNTEETGTITKVTATAVQGLSSSFAGSL